MFKQMAETIHKEFNKNEQYLTQSKNLLEKLNKNFSKLKEFCNSSLKMSKVIDDNQNKIKLIINNLEYENKKLNINIENEEKNLKILNENNDIDINIPNDYLLNFCKELEERIIIYTHQIEEISILINLYYNNINNENGNNDEDNNNNNNSIEELIYELYNCIKLLLTEEYKINMKVNILKEKFKNILQFNYGYNIDFIKNRFNSYQNSFNQKYI